MKHGNFHVEHFFHKGTNTFSYVVHDGQTSAVIDPVLDFDLSSGRTSTKNAEEIISYVKDNNLKNQWVLETHAHADHLSAAPFVKKNLGGFIAIGEHIEKVRAVFADMFNDQQILQSRLPAFDKTFTDREGFRIGNIHARFVHTPGHTPACGMYVLEDKAAFVGDTLFMPDAGTARCDFPGGSTERLYKSITEKIFALPDETTLYMCHDYGADGKRDVANETTVKEEKENNIHVGGDAGMDAFVKMRAERDATLDLPKLIVPSVQVNIRAGELPPAEDNGVRYVKIPLDKL